MTATPSRDVLAQRSEIDAAAQGKTICDILARNAETHGDEPALSWEEDGGWRTLSWRQYREQVAALTLGLKDLGVGKGDVVALMIRNRPEHVIADMAVVHAGGTPVSFYNTLAPEQIQYIAAHCDARLAILENREVMERWEKVKAELPSLQRVVLLEDAAEFGDYDWATPWDDVMRKGTEALQASDGWDRFEASRREVKPEDMATLVYTSGTTGNPKAVIITQRNVVWTAISLDRAVMYPGGLRAISYLPLAHIAERMATHYLGMYKLAHTSFCPDVLRIREVLPHVRPQAFLGVPRVWEKIQAGVMAALQAEPNERKRKLAMQAIEAGKEAARRRAEGKPVPLGVRLKQAALGKLVYPKIKHGVGLDQSTLNVTAAAPIAPDTLYFFAGIGLPLAEVYGMTEDSGPATANAPDAIRVGTVGAPLPGVEVRLADDGEVLVRGGNVSPGYYKDPEKTAETFDAEGWLHTGDIGKLDDAGYLKIVDRKKELLITAGGKNISPANLEALLKQHPLIGQACVVGDRKPFVAALIVLDGETAPAWASSNGVTFGNLAEFAREPRVAAEIQKAVDDANQHLSNVERIKKFVILPAEWTVDSEELTPTLKLKRRVVHQKYAEEIEGIYASA
jgi:long-subunit acyl-CoA synthetase (AMP-forming)